MKSPYREHSRIICLLGLLSVITPFAIDMYLPAFSQVAADLKTTTSVIALSLSSYFIGFAFGQILYGPLLDRFGRKRPLYVGLIVYIVASSGCALAQDIQALIVLRFLQAIGGCAAQVAALAMVRDFFHAKESARIFSLLFLIIGISPLLASSIGSLLASSLGWRWIFAILGIYALVTLILIFALLPEGHVPDSSVSLKPGPILDVFWSILKQPQFYTYAMAGAFSFAGLFAFVSGSPILFMEKYHLGTKMFGLVFAVLVMGFIGGNQVNVFLLNRFSSQQIFFYALLFQVLMGVVLFTGTRAHLLGLPGMMVLFFFFLFSIGLTYPNAAALGMAPFSREAGSASALLGFLQAGAGSLIATAIGVLGASSIVTLLSLTPIVALVILVTSRTRITQLAESEQSVSVVH
ncbi:multidrug effflux MFS transporter [Edaphobacter albus]|uniref:multidrug effflux MFS transporter n=1 Tax=Edaphobacter sp. 4G125 TaxID=2763071 RepID=UPI001648D59F|nr:multidrug effflux MFS transporter [Edaphobacter sp. 4G125]QNI36339.1 multidrug effflux MFS transporter [Edaphobacter sp. 4G125]